LLNGAINARASILDGVVGAGTVAGGKGCATFQHEDRRDSPAAQQQVVFLPLLLVVQRQNKVVAHIIVSRTLIGAFVIRIAWAGNRTSTIALREYVADFVQNLAVGVVGIELETVGIALAQAGLQAVVVRVESIGAEVVVVEETRNTCGGKAAVVAGCIARSSNCVRSRRAGRTSGVEVDVIQADELPSKSADIVGLQNVATADLILEAKVELLV